MQIAKRRFEAVEGQNRLFRETVARDADFNEPVLQSRLAELCFVYQDLVEFGIAQFERINELDRSWRRLVFERQLDYLPEFDRWTEELYRDWRDASQRVLALYQVIEKCGYRDREFPVARVRDLGAAVHEIGGALTPDEEFFGSDKLNELEREALVEFRNGDAEEVIADGEGLGRAKR